jgi:hypothetical protein
MPMLLSAPAVASNAWLELNFLVMVAGLVILNLLTRSE